MEWNDTFFLVVMEFFLQPLHEPNVTNIKPMINSIDLRFSNVAIKLKLWNI
jgi:hypothetical protein